MFTDMIKSTFEEMLKSYVDTYFESEEGQKTILLTVIKMFNQRNLSKAENTLFEITANKDKVENAIHITKRISDIVNAKQASQFTEKELKALSDSVIQINDLLDILTSQTTSSLVINDKLSEIRNNAILLNIPQKTLTREEFLALADDCFEDEEPDYSNYLPREKVQETTLRKTGYSVAANDPRSNYRRQQDLKKKIDDGTLDKNYVIWQLKQHIKDNENKKRNSMAVAKWKLDLEFVSKL